MHVEYISRICMYINEKLGHEAATFFPISNAGPSENARNNRAERVLKSSDSRSPYNCTFSRFDISPRTTKGSAFLFYEPETRDKMQYLAVILRKNEILCA